MVTKTTATNPKPAASKVAFRKPPTAKPHLVKPLPSGDELTTSRAGEAAIELDLDLIEFDPEQHRQEYDDDALGELAFSIREHGVLQSITVRPATPEGRYPLVIGERRVRAARLAGLKTVPAQVRELTEKQADFAQLVENTQREGVNPIHTGQKIKRMLERHGLEQKELALKIGKSETYVAQHLKLLELPPQVAALAEVGEVRDVDTLANLAKLTEVKPEAAQELIDKASKGEGLTRETSRKALKEAKTEKNEAKHKGDKAGAQIKSTEEPGAVRQTKGAALPAPEAIEKEPGLAQYWPFVYVAMAPESVTSDDFEAARQGLPAWIDFGAFFKKSEGGITTKTTDVYFGGPGKSLSGVPLADLRIVGIRKP